MSYDFYLMKPKAEIRSQQDLGEENLLKQDQTAIVNALTELFPTLLWSRSDDGGRFGALDGEDTWYEFRIGPVPDHVWVIHTSHKTRTRILIPFLCKALGLIAFDGQAMSIIGPEGERPA